MYRFYGNAGLENNELIREVANSGNDYSVCYSLCNDEPLCQSVMVKTNICALYKKKQGMGPQYIVKVVNGEHWLEKSYCPGWVNYKLFRHTRTTWNDANDYAID
jgi:hypothetical protein